MTVDLDDALLTAAPGERARDAVVGTGQRDQVDVLIAVHAGDLAHRDAGRFCHARRVDVADGVFGDAAEEPLQHREAEDAGVVGGDLAVTAQLERIR